MTQSSLHYAAFITDIKKKGSVFTIYDQGGIPAPMGDKGKRSMPFWTTKTRVTKIVKTVEAYSKMSIREVTYEEFVMKWLPGLKRDGLNVGCNWSGTKAVGYDVEPDSILKSIGCG